MRPIFFLFFTMLFMVTFPPYFAFDPFGHFFHSKEQPSADEDSSENNSECKEYTCGSGACVATPDQCPCPENEKKCMLQDWYLCIPSDQECPSYLQSLHAHLKIKNGASSSSSSSSFEPVNDEL
ncbi:hypothetical protein HMI54_005659 [Coelomomyces lativittatus]|nr:hypothetical protein HMI54_005659 [Coelomomyces lativittatus]